MKRIIMYNRKKTKVREEPLVKKSKENPHGTSIENGMTIRKYKLVTCRGAPVSCMVMLVSEEEDSHGLVDTICFGITRCHKNDTFSKKEGRKDSETLAIRMERILMSYPMRCRNKFWHSADFRMGHAPVNQFDGVVTFFRRLESLTRKAEYEKRCLEAEKKFKEEFPGMRVVNAKRTPSRTEITDVMINRFRNLRRDGYGRSIEKPQPDVV